MGVGATVFIFEEVLDSVAESITFPLTTVASELKFWQLSNATTVTLKESVGLHTAIYASSSFDSTVVRYSLPVTVFSMIIAIFSKPEISVNHLTQITLVVSLMLTFVILGGFPVIPIKRTTQIARVHNIFTFIFMMQTRAIKVMQKEYTVVYHIHNCY